MKPHSKEEFEKISNSLFFLVKKNKVNKIKIIPNVIEVNKISKFGRNLEDFSAYLKLLL